MWTDRSPWHRPFSGLSPHPGLRLEATPWKEYIFTSPEHRAEVSQTDFAGLPIVQSLTAGSTARCRSIKSHEKRGPWRARCTLPLAQCKTRTHDPSPTRRMVLQKVPIFRVTQERTSTLWMEEERQVMRLLQNWCTTLLRAKLIHETAKDVGRRRV